MICRLSEQMKSYTKRLWLGFEFHISTAANKEVNTKTGRCETTVLMPFRNRPIINIVP